MLKFILIYEENSDLFIKLDNDRVSLISLRSGLGFLRYETWTEFYSANQSIPLLPPTNFLLLAHVITWLDFASRDCLAECAMSVVVNSWLDKGCLQRIPWIAIERKISGDKLLNEWLLLQYYPMWAHWIMTMDHIRS